jgi:hypothetical protein
MQGLRGGSRDATSRATVEARTPTPAATTREAQAARRSDQIHWKSRVTNRESPLRSEPALPSLVASMPSESERLDVGEEVILLALPPGFLDALDGDEQRVVAAMIGKSVKLVGYDEHGRAVLNFPAPFDVQIWIAPEFIARVRA